MKETYITGTIQAGSSRIPQVATHLQLIDYLGAMMVRWSINRNGYLVSPGLYAVGNPDSASDVFVAANYKLSFDTLRKNLAGLNAWILVLDTRGINVWCAAGKGTFGTAELVNRIRLTSLEMIVTHRRLIVPQLGAVGVSAHRVKKETGAVESSAVKPAATKSFTDISFSGTSIKANRGFTVKYGPVRASDIKKYLAAGYKTDEKMRRVTFPFLERLKLVPVELVYSGKYLLIALAAIFALSVFGKQGIDLTSGFVSMMLLVTGYLAGAAVSPMILPWLPFRSFALKGLIAGILCTWSILVFYFPMPWFLSLAWMLINSGIASFLAMNFTGASTYTSLSGVKKEMKTAIPLQIASVSLGLVLLIVLKFI